ncbi:MAG: DUF4445 domain-containing protein, partial [Nitrospirales bacterium]|nr:DUF4445 domain-containing protein [Nitrospirales bacterium]
MELRLTSDEVIELREGEDIYSALKRAGVYLVAPCGGKGTCGKCKVKVLEGDHEVISHGRLTAKERESGLVLACRTIPKGDVFIDIPKESRLMVGDKIAIARTKDLAEYLRSYGVEMNPMAKMLTLELPEPTISDNISDLERIRRALDEKGLKDMRFSRGLLTHLSRILRSSGWRVSFTFIGGDSLPEEAIFVGPAEGNRGIYGIAVDIGTTTVVVYLINLTTGEIVDIGSTYNSQMRYGDDVITRIIHATEGGGLEELRKTVVSDINAIVDSLAERHGVETGEVVSAVISANTSMAHIFWGFDPESIRLEPYIPTLNYFPLWKAVTAGIDINTQAAVYTIPCIASYVGGDIVAGVLATKMHRNPEIALFMDIGTNGEIAVGNNEWLMAAACSMGPCFEGSGIRCGMRATPGAIESVKIDPVTFEPTIGVIGGGHPMGICGTGMIDAISEMFLTGLIDMRGKFVRDKSERVRDGEEGPEYLIYHDEKLHRDIVLSEVDLENLIRAKAALYAGITTLLNEVGLTIDAVEKVYVAGGFGNYINVEKAIILGMFPDVPRERFVFMGNTSITGAYLSLLSHYGFDSIYASAYVNPAGLGLYRKSEFLFSPGLGYAQTKADYISMKADDYKYQFVMNSMGYIGTYNSGKEKGMVSATYAVGYNRLNNFNNNTVITGINEYSSFSDYF